MKALLYLIKRTAANNLKKAVRKPTTLLALIFGAAYGIFLIVMLGTLAVTVRIDSVQGLVILVTVWTIYITVGNFMSYASRKGILFRPAHSQFVFPAPISPKLVLIQGAWMNYLMSFFIWIVLAIGGLTVFHVEWWKMLFFFLIGCGVECAVEQSVMIILYTNDKLPQKLIKGICFGMKVFLIAFTLMIVLYFKEKGLSVESALSFINWPVLQMIPVVGWQIAVYRLVLLGPTTLNVICTVIYSVFTVFIVAAAFRMKCDGGYYEEAAKFADDYAELKKRQKSGEFVTNTGTKKRRFRRVESKITAKGARAIFYRQFLEYKKEKYFIFTKMTVLSAVVAFIFAYSLQKSVSDSSMAGFILLGVVAYVALIMSGYTGKWESELKNPYIFLIPDSPLKKMWYATLMEHVKAFADGCIICIPIGIFWHVPVIEIIYCILIYTVLQADCLYTMVIVQSLLGEVFGKTGQSLLRMFIQMALLGVGAGVGVLAAVLISQTLIFPIVLIYGLMITVAMGAIALLRFDTMEQFV